MEEECRVVFLLGVSLQGCVFLRITALIFVGAPYPAGGVSHFLGVVGMCILFVFAQVFAMVGEIYHYGVAMAQAFSHLMPETVGI